MLQIVHVGESEYNSWDRFVYSDYRGTCYHLTSWKIAIERVYCHRSYYLMALSTGGQIGGAPDQGKIVGVLPLFHLNNVLFGNHLVSLPFCDYGGILADDGAVAQVLLQKAMELASHLYNASVEFRHVERVASDRLETSAHKVRMALELNGDAEQLWNSFDGKLRSQIRKPEKEGLVSQIGGAELLDDFYTIFSFNMRDLGSPVHSKKLPQCVLEEFGDSAKLQVVYNDKTPVGGGLIICFRDTVFIPWASTVRQFNRLSPNMMLYWNFLKYAADNGFRKFDFGRSSPNEGTYKFKEQWGAKATPLHWQYASPNGSTAVIDPLGKEKYSALVSVWKKLPLPVANFIGPHIRKYISL